MSDLLSPEEIQALLKEAEAQGWFARMVPGIAHDMNTLLGICITANSHLHAQLDRMKAEFEGGKLGKTAFAGYLQRIREASELLDTNLGRARALAGSLKHLSVSQAQHEPEMTDLGTLLGEIALAFSPQLKQHPHHLEVKAPEVLMVRTHPADLSRVLMNLVQNAMVHGFPDDRAGHVLLQAEATDEGALVKVADDGVGMDAETLAHVFEPYFTTRRNAGGTGLGLSLCKELVEGPLAGHIRVESVHGYGSTFHLSLPNLASSEGASHG